ncbi:AmmeMemoRadiSam system protein A [Halothermothrix orenii]|uniref:AMMECR1 domain protein n=1 Tax=Halothermothrix orenii (strain H 168 / OCM 544 / DSM 9562) TaxID=373903 RepID=B8D0U6_HALOH|nr:AmmeMemoRadiSam system protein A [Halothermothrix orenii]ACL68915.1 AMMECR1 domain protein [Halothermothrix orenii H 168]ACL69010.1 AMMECR1 domain protein [Halothermothrix orenii H 168]
MSKLSSYITGLARKTIEVYIKEGRQIKELTDLPEELKKRAGVFVSLKKDGKLRGCIGTFLPTQDNIAQEIIKNAISAAVHDPRFGPVRVEELNKIEISVDILTEPEKVNNRNELDPHKYGILVKKGHRTGLLLPDLEGIDSVEKQLEIARLKAGIRPDEEVEIYRFQVKRYKER